MKLYYINNKKESEEFEKQTRLNSEWQGDEDKVITAVHKGKKATLHFTDDSVPIQMIKDVVNEMIHQLAEEHIELSPERWEKIKEDLELLNQHIELMNKVEESNK